MFVMVDSFVCEALKREATMPAKHSGIPFGITFCRTGRRDQNSHLNLQILF